MNEWNQVLIWLITSMSVHTCLNEVLDEVFFFLRCASSKIMIIRLDNAFL